MNDTVLVLLLAPPLLAVWVFALVDIVRRADLTPARKTVWALLCTLLWPVLFVYLLTRPTSGRLLLEAKRTDPHAQLVDTVLAHEDGRLDDIAAAERLHALRRS